MDIERFFVNYKKPDIYFYLNESCFKILNNNNNEEKTYQINSFNEFKEILLSLNLNSNSCGIILNSRDFIFNFLNFDKLPVIENKVKEIVEWRLSKIFPENLDNYIHNYISLSKNKILSVLFKKEIHDKLNELSNLKNLRMIDLKNTTLSLLSKLNRNRLSSDLLIEIDSLFVTMTFFNNRVPFFIRKFEVYEKGEIIEEVFKVKTYVENNYSKKVEKFVYYSACDSDIELVNDFVNQKMTLIKHYNSKDLI